MMLPYPPSMWLCFVSLEVPAWSLFLAQAKKWLSCSASLVTFPSSGIKWLNCPRSGEKMALLKCLFDHFSLLGRKLAVVYLKICKLY